MNIKIQFSRIITLTALTIFLVVPVFVFAASYSHAAQNIVDGDLVTVSPNPDIYIVKIIGVKKFKRLILNPDIFNSYGHLKWSNVKMIDQAALDSYKLSELVIEINPDGSVADPKVYRVVSSENSDVGERSWLNLTASEFEAAGYDWDSLYKVNHKEALPSFYPTKTPLTYQDVIKIKQAPSLPAPAAFSIALVAPNKILAGYAREIVIRGTGFKQGAKVDFGSGETQVVASVISPEQISVLVPAKMPPLTYNLAITNPDGQIAMLDNALTIQSAPTITSVGLSGTEIFQKVAPSTTLLFTGNGSNLSAGTGIVLSSDGYILTNQHVVDNYSSVDVYINDDGYFHQPYKHFTGTVLGTDPANDLAVVKISASGLRAIEFGSSDNQNLPVGSKVYALGFPLIFDVGADSVKFFPGEVVGIASSYLQISAPIQPGNSGGPLVNNKGQLVGINNLCLTTNQSFCTLQGQAFAIAIDYANPLIPGLKAGVSTPTTTPTPTPQVGTLTVSKDPASPSGNIAKDYTDQEFARFAFSASGEAVKISSLNVSAATTGNVGINNARLYVNGVQIGTTTDLPATGIATFTFGNSFIVPAGATQTLVVKGEVKGADGASFYDGNAIQVSLVAGSSNAQGQTSLTSINTPTINGNSLTVRSGALSVILNPSLSNATASNPTAVKGATGVKIASFILSASSGEAVAVTQIVVKNSGSAGLGLGNDFQNLRLMNNATQIGTTISSLSTAASNTYTFTPASAITINAGQQYIVDVYADVLVSATNIGSAYAAVVLESVTATGKSTSVDASYTSTSADVNGQQIYLVTGGNLTVTAGSDTPIAQTRSMGQTGQTLATFKFTTGASEAVNITKIVITDTISGNTNGAAGSIVNLKLFNAAGTQVGSTIASMSNDAKATFDGLTYQIAKDKSETLTLKGDINNYPNAVPGSVHVFSIADPSTTNVMASGATTGSQLTGTSIVISSAAGTAQTVYRSELTVANAMSNMTGGASSQQQIGKYTFTNTSAGNYAITISNLNLNINSTLGAGTGTMTIKRDSSSGPTLATKTFTNELLTNITSWDAPFTPFTIDATNGTGSVDIYILVDTSSFNASAAKTISTSFSATGVTWTDGVSSGIANIDGAPVYGATVTY